MNHPRLKIFIIQGVPEDVHPFSNLKLLVNEIRDITRSELAFANDWQYTLREVYYQENKFLIWAPEEFWAWARTEELDSREFCAMCCIGPADSCEVYMTHKPIVNYQGKDYEIEDWGKYIESPIHNLTDGLHYYVKDEGDGKMREWVYKGIRALLGQGMADHYIFESVPDPSNEYPIMLYIRTDELNWEDIADCPIRKASKKLHQSHFLDDDENEAEDEIPRKRNRPK